MLCPICSCRLAILFGVKFWSRLLTALNLLPSMATAACVKSLRSRHMLTKRRHTLRIPVTEAVTRPACELNRQLGRIRTGSSCEGYARNAAEHWKAASATPPGSSRSVPLFRRQRSLDLLAQARHCSSLFALAFCSRFFIGCPGTKFRNQASALDRATETA